MTAYSVTRTGSPGLSRLRRRAIGGRYDRDARRFDQVQQIADHRADLEDRLRDHAVDKVVTDAVAYEAEHPRDGLSGWDSSACPREVPEWVVPGRRGGRDGSVRELGAAFAVRVGQGHRHSAASASVVQTVVEEESVRP